MPQDSTTADAQGNANAQVYVETTPLPAELEFREYLLPAELALHFEFNEEVLELAEELEQIENELNASYRSDFYSAGGPARDGVLNVAGQNRVRLLQERIEAKEREILDEISEVESEFRMLARNLTDNRRRTIVLNQQMDSVRNNPPVGAQPYEVGLSMQGAQMGLDSLQSTFEQYLESYELIKQGFAFQSSSEAWRNFAIGFAQIIALEVATLGAAKFFRVAQAANRIRQAVVGSSYYAAMAARYAALAAATKRRLQRLRRTRQPERAPDRSNTGPTSRSDGPNTPATNCNGIRCAL